MSRESPVLTAGPERSGWRRKIATPAFIYLLAALSFGYIAIEIRQHLAAQQAESRRDLRVASRSAAIGAERFMLSWERVFSTLAESPCARTKDAETCGVLFSRLKSRFPELVNLLAIDRDGDYYASALPLPESPRSSARQLKSYREIADGRQRYIAEPQPGPIAGEMLGAMSSAANDQNGRFDGVFGISFRLDDLLQHSIAAAGVNGGGLLIVSREGRIVAARDSFKPWFGKSLAELGWAGEVLSAEQDLNFSLGGIGYHAHVSLPKDSPWGFMAFERTPGLTEALLRSELGEFFLSVPLAILAIIAAVVAARTRRSELALVDSERALRQALDRTEAAVNERAAQLASSEALYRTLFEQSPGAIVLLDGDGNILEFNANAARLTGFTTEELSGMNVSQLDATMSPPEARAWVARTIALGGEPFESLARRKDGTTYPVLVSARPIVSSCPEFPRLLCLWSDLSPLKREQRLREQLQRRLQAVVEGTGDGVLLIDGAGKILYANSALCALVGWTPLELLDQPLTMLIPSSTGPVRRDGLAPVVQSESNVLDLLDLPSGHSVERRCLHRNGGEIPIELTLASWTESGETFFSATLRDLSEQKRAHDRLRFTQKMEAVGILAGGIAHDFNNLLAIVMGHAQLAHDAAPADSPIRVYGEKIIKAVLRARTIIKQLLDFSRSTDEAPRAMSLAVELGEIETLLLASLPRHITLRSTVEPASSAIYAIPHQVQQMLINLINNACDAIGERPGEIDISLNEETRSDAGGALVGKLVPGRYAVLRIRDTGPGISDELMGRIFVPFFTTKEVGRGTGLGLAVVGGIMEEIGGAVAVTNRLSGGACFELFFPVINASPLAAVDQTVTACGNGDTILMVDDEPEVVEAYLEYLASKGFVPLFAVSGEQALSLVAQHGRKIRAVVSDLLMPGMDGVTLAARLAHQLPGVPVLLLTGRGEVLQASELAAHGIAGLIAKPVEPRIIAGELRRVIDLADRQNA